MSYSETDLAEEVFEDAIEDNDSPDDLHRSILAASVALNCFFENKFNEAENLMEMWAHKSLYHALGKSVIVSLKAFLQFQPEGFEKANTVLKKSLEFINSLRRKSTISESMSKIVKRPDYNSYTDTEMHAELCYAEILLLRAAMSILEDETLISLVKGGFKIRQCYQSYKECWYMLKSDACKNSPNRTHFESGVRLGIGTFNMIISQLPPPILKLLEFVGFSGNKQLGIRELNKGLELKGALRMPLISLVLLAEKLVFEVFMLGRNPDFSETEKLMNLQKQVAPNSLITHYLEAKFYLIDKSDIAMAKHFYQKAVDCQDEIEELKYLSYWELVWLSNCEENWKEAQKIFDLMENCKWSRSIGYYNHACTYFMLSATLSEEERENMRFLMRDCPALRYKIAGKSLPLEKFFARKAERFFAQGEYLTLPLHEAMYIWNNYLLVSKNFDVIHRMYTVIDEERERLESIPVEDRLELHTDNVLLTYFLKGVCLSHLNSPLQAAECFKYVISQEKTIKVDKYLIPASLLEIAVLHIQSKDNRDLRQAKTILEYAKNNYKGYGLDARLGFRIHGELNAIKEELKELKNPTLIGDFEDPVPTIRSKKLYTKSIMNGTDTQGNGTDSSVNGTSNNYLLPVSPGSAGARNLDGESEEDKEFPRISRSPSPFTPTSDQSMFEDLAPELCSKVQLSC